ncbi:D-2-hydroxyglutarate dehydrogenase, mitochondrial-like isoform X1 [Diadema antillarum]|uniref:D-2-hydroxyglutarate dehydrogenase, mitochondrial-like isoform X1 n=2 Tax=Diadema antillarum TaxID=105358 RepID=UPI003A864D27
MHPLRINSAVRTVTRATTCRWANQEEALMRRFPRSLSACGHLSHPEGSAANCRSQRCVFRHVIPGQQCQSRLICTSPQSCSTGTEVPLTRDRFPSVVRGDYGKVGEDDVRFFHELLEGRIITDEDELSGANTDWMRICRGSSRLMLRPKTTEEVSKILAYCHSRNLAVVPQGGNTGLVGGSVPVFDEVIVSTTLMNQVLSIDETSGILVAQAGCVLEKLDSVVSEYGLAMPLDLGAKGSCCIGGNVSTNAGGLRLLRYGSLHGTVLGVEAVLADGQIVDCLSSLNKDNTGYDLKQLFIGSEGTLGIVTAVAIKCPQRPKAVNLAFLGVSDFENVKTTFRESRRNLSEVLSACEVMDHASMEVIVNAVGLSNPLSDHPFYMLVETSGSNSAHDEEKLNSFLESALSAGYVADGTVATEVSKIQALWALRERIAEGLVRMGWCFKYDLTIPINHFYGLVEETRERLSGTEATVVGYGHVGDENLHLNVVTPQYDSHVHKILEPFVYEWTSNLKGSISAEHGLGFLKRNYIGLSKAAAAVGLMRGIKAMMDPKGILNPYKVLP